MMNKGVENLKLILILALGFLIFMYFVPMASNEMNTACRQSQMEELGRVLEQLDKFDKMNQTILVGSYSMLEGFDIKQACTSEIRYEKGEKSYLIVGWKNGGTQKIRTDAEWQMEDASGLIDMKLTEGTCVMKVSLGKVIAMSCQRKL